MRLGLESLGWDSVGYCEIDAGKRAVYQSNFRLNGEFQHGDIKTMKMSAMPSFNILVSGFPCQSFSRAGLFGGLEDERGALFFDLLRVLRHVRPKAILLENVQGLTLMKRDFAVVLSSLKKLGYSVIWRILNSRDYGLPQNRPRVFIVGFHRNNGAVAFAFPKRKSLRKSVIDLMERKPSLALFANKKIKGSVKMFIRPDWKTRRGSIIILGNHLPSGFNTGAVLSPYGVSKCLVPSDEPVLNHPYYLVRRSPISMRRLSPREWARLQGFPDSFRLDGHWANAYRHVGDSVSVPVVSAIGREMEKCLTC